MDDDKVIALVSILSGVIKRQVTPEIFEWMQEKATLIREETSSKTLTAAFAAVPRKTGKLVAEISADELAKVDHLYQGFTIKNWPLDKISRLWLLLQVSPEDEKTYYYRIEGLFRDAEMNELISLYAALPVFAYPESWKFRTTEGIRSNIGTVLESIMYDNPYPSQYLSEASWNQLILKAFFTDKDINRITGLDERANQALAAILVDYAHERQAAHRMVNPQLWRLVSKYIDENSIQDIEKLFDDAHITVRRAAVLACYNSDYEPAKRLMEKEPAIVRTINSKLLSWSSL